MKSSLCFSFRSLVCLTLMLPSSGFAWSCKDLFSVSRPLSHETVSVLDYLDQPLLETEKRSLKARWAKIDSQLKTLQLFNSSFGKKALKYILSARTDMSNTLSGKFTKQADVLAAQRNFKRVNAFLLAELAKDREINGRFILELYSLHEFGKQTDARAAYRQIEVAFSKRLLKVIEYKDVPEAMAALLSWYKLQNMQMHPIELASRFYQKFISIHPFEDANGRVGRDLMDFILMKNGYPPSMPLDAENLKAGVTYFHLDPKNKFRPMSPLDAIRAFTEGVEETVSFLREEYGATGPVAR